MEGVPKEDKAVVHFWHLFGSIPACRQALTSSPRDSVYRNAPLLESRVRALARVFDTETSGLDVPRVLTKEPELLLCEANEVLRRVLELKRIAPELGGRALTAAPGLLLCDPQDVAAARQEMEFATLEQYRDKVAPLDSREFLRKKFCNFKEDSRRFRELTADGGLNYAKVVIMSGFSLEECIHLPWVKKTKN